MRESREGGGREESVDHLGVFYHLGRRPDGRRKKEKGVRGEGDRLRSRHLPGVVS